MIVVIDNYDSFTYNLVQALGVLGCEVRVFRNDRTSLEEIGGLSPDRILVSPGPCTPLEAGISCDITPLGMEKSPIICSLTHLRVSPAHPLAKEIRAYQTARTRRLAHQSGTSRL